MEAARICAGRGHEVVLFEASAKLGGQVLLAGKPDWRRDLLGITDWLEREIDRLGVSVRLNHFAEREDILKEAPDVVFIATGDRANWFTTSGRHQFRYLIGCAENSVSG